MLVIKNSSNNLSIAGSRLVLPYQFHDSFKRSDGAVGNNWMDFSDTSANYDPTLIVNNAWSWTLGQPTGGCLSYRDTGLSDNFHIRFRFLASNNWPTSLINQVGPALFIDPTVADQDIYLGLAPVTDFTISRYYFNNIANMDQATFNEQYQTASLIFPTSMSNNEKLGVNNPLAVLEEGDKILWDVYVVGGEMLFTLNGLRYKNVLGDYLAPVPIPEQFIGRTKHGMMGRVGSFPTDRLCDYWFIEPYSTPLDEL